MTSKMDGERVSRRTLLGVVGAGVAGSALLPPWTGSAAPVARRTSTFSNPVSLPTAENAPDMATIRARDGYWYLYSTSGPLFRGDERHHMKILRSPDLVNWEFVGDVFSEDNLPTWGERAMLGPAIRYFDGGYVLYYRWIVKNPAEEASGRATAIGAATAPTPTGPWTDLGGPLVPPQTWEPWPGHVQYQSIIGPEHVTAPDGSHYLYYGSRGGGVWGAELAEDGLAVSGDQVRITPPLRYEGPFVVHRDGWYYMFLSSIGGCCFGPASTYGVYVARSRHPLGPFVDADGFSILDNNGGGSPVLTMNGNSWIGLGHNVVATDLTGQDWMVYHGFDRFHPFLNPDRDSGDRRCFFIDRLDWIDGWPTVNGGQGASLGPVAAPAVAGFVADSFESSATLGDAWVPSTQWHIDEEPEGRYVVSDPMTQPGDRFLYARNAVTGDVLARGSVRLEAGTGGAAGFALDKGADAHGARVLIDREAGVLAVEVRRAATTRRVEEALPAPFDHRVWHHLAVSVRSGRLRAEVSHAGLYDPLAIVETTLPLDLRPRRFGLVARDASAAFDDVSAAELFRPATDKARDPEAGVLDLGESEEFTAPLSDQWEWVRSPAASVADGQLVFPLQRATLVDRFSELGHNNASVLLREAPDGEWTMETRITVDFGDAIPMGFPQAGLIVYHGDDDYIVHTYSGRTVARWVGFGREMTYRDQVLYAWSAVGPAADTLYLRLKHTISGDTGEHQYHAAHSVDGERWSWHHIYPMPGDWSPRVGFAAFDAHESYVARFDYLRFYRP